MFLKSKYFVMQIPCPDVDYSEYSKQRLPLRMELAHLLQQHLFIENMPAFR